MKYFKTLLYTALLLTSHCSIAASAGIDAAPDDRMLAIYQSRAREIRDDFTKEVPAVVDALTDVSINGCRTYADFKGMHETLYVGMGGASKPVAGLPVEKYPLWARTCLELFRIHRDAADAHAPLGDQNSYLLRAYQNVKWMSQEEDKFKLFVRIQDAHGQETVNNEVDDLCSQIETDLGIMYPYSFSLAQSRLPPKYRSITGV